MPFDPRMRPQEMDPRMARPRPMPQPVAVPAGGDPAGNMPGQRPAMRPEGQQGYEREGFRGVGPNGEHGGPPEGRGWNRPDFPGRGMALGRAGGQGEVDPAMLAEVIRRRKMRQAAMQGGDAGMGGGGMMSLGGYPAGKMAAGTPVTADGSQYGMRGGGDYRSGPSYQEGQVPAWNGGVRQGDPSKYAGMQEPTYAYGSRSADPYSPPVYGSASIMPLPVGGGMQPMTGGGYQANPEQPSFYDLLAYQGAYNGAQ